MLKQKAIKQGTAKAVPPFPYAYKTLIERTLQDVVVPARAVSNGKLFKVISSVIIIQYYHRISLLRQVRLHP